MKFQPVIFLFFSIVLFSACPSSKKDNKQVEPQNTSTKEIPVDLAPSNAKRKVQNILNSREDKIRKHMDQIKNAR